MKKFFLSVVIGLLFVAAVTAQQRNLTLDDIYSVDQARRLPFAGSPARLLWSGKPDSYKQMQDGKLVRVNAQSGEATPYFDGSKLEAALVKAGIDPQLAKRTANSGGLYWNSTETAILLNLSNDLWVYTVETAALKKLTNGPELEVEADFSPDSAFVSFVRSNDLYIVDRNGIEKRITKDGSSVIYNGYLDWVYEEELYGRGNKRGYWWSPDSKSIAFLRTDESPVPKFIITEDTGEKQVVESLDYPKAGEPNPIVRLGVAKTTGEVSFVDLVKYDPADLLIARVSWTPDNNLLFQALNREQTFLDLNVVNFEGGANTLLTETTPAWVEVYGTPMFVGNKKNHQFVWESARSGWKHLYLYSDKGEMIRQLTDGKWEVRTVYGIDEKNDWVYFSATKDSHIAENIYRVKLSGGKVERLSTGEGTHAAMFNSDYSMYVDTWSDINTPPQVRLYRADGKLIRVISENKVELFNSLRLGKTEFLKVNARDGFEMEAAMIKPPDFDPTKKYPVLQYTYAGPHAPQVINRWGGNRYMWHQMLAQKGYIIWVMDNRSASGKGAESTWPIYKNMGPLELRDIEDGVTYLKSLPYVDGNRLGIWGWSFGGFMTSYAMTHSTHFKMGIAGGSVTDWALYDSIYTDRLMRTPQNNKDGYAKTSVLSAAADLNGKILLIHGVMDNNVHEQNTIKFVYELQKHNKQFELMLYPTQQHGVVNPPQVRHMYELMTNFIEKNL